MSEMVKAGEFAFTPEQEKMILDNFAGGATPSEAKVLMAVATLRKLNPLLGQIHFVKRQAKGADGKYRDAWSTQVSIDGLRAIAERSGLYDGQDAPIFEVGEKGNLLCAKVAVYRKDWARPAWGVAHFAEYAQRKADGSLTKFWKEKPHVMLAKCAESMALRKAFPEQTSGLYSPEEVGEEGDLNNLSNAKQYTVTEDGEVLEKPKRRPAALPAMDPSPPKEIEQARAAPTLAAPKEEVKEDVKEGSPKEEPKDEKEANEEREEASEEASAAPTVALHQNATLQKGAKKGHLMREIPVAILRKYLEKYPETEGDERASIEHWISSVPWE